MNFCQVSALNMLYGGFREISNFWHFSSNFLHELFKNPDKHQKMAQKNISTYRTDVKFPAEHDSWVRKNLKNRGKPENRKTHVSLEKFIREKPTLIKSPNLAEVYFRACYRFTLLGIQEVYTHFYHLFISFNLLIIY